MSYIEADIALENTIVALDVNLANVDVKLVFNELCELQDDTNAVDSTQFNR